MCLVAPVRHSRGRPVRTGELASRIFDPSLLNTDTVAFGGSLAKLSSLSLLGDRTSHHR
jgi:hypothetical protein